MLQVPVFTDYGRRLTLGLTYDANDKIVGPDIFPVDTKKYKENINIYELDYRYVGSVTDVREFLGVPAELSLQIKAGLVNVTGAGLCLKELNTEPDRAHVIIRLRCLTSKLFLRPSDHVYSASTTAEGLGTHFVKDVLYGGQMFVCLIAKASDSIEKIHGSKKGPLPIASSKRLPLEDELGSLLQCLSDTTGVEIRYYGETGTRSGTLEEVIDLLETRHSRLSNEGRGEIIEINLQPLTLLRLEGVPEFNENHTLRPILTRFEQQYEDLQISQTAIDKFYCDGSELVDNGAEQLLAFTEDLRSLIMEYEELIGQLGHDVSTRLKEEVMALMRKYGKVQVEGGEKGAWLYLKRTKEILAKHSVKYVEAEYDVIDKEAWFKYRERGWSQQQIKNEDIREGRRIKDMMDRYTLKRNKCQDHRHQQSELRIVLLGKTGVGKSATGNTITGNRNHFVVSGSAHSVTQTIHEQTIHFRGRVIRLLDTPGLFDTDRDKRAVDYELAKVLAEFCDGIHAFVYVINLATHRFTAEEQAALREVKRLFGEELMKFTVIVLTHADAALTSKTLQSYIEELPSGPLRDVIVKETNMRVMAINNNFTFKVEQERQRDALIDIVDIIQESTEGHCYTNNMFHKVKDLQLQSKRRSDKMKRDTRESEWHKYKASMQRLRDVCRQTTRDEYARKTASAIEDEEKDQYKSSIINIKDRARQQLQESDSDVLTYLDGLSTSDGSNVIDHVVCAEVQIAAAEYKADKRRRAALQHMRDEVENVLKKNVINLHTEKFTTDQAMNGVRARFPPQISEFIEDADIKREIQVQIGSNTIKNAIENRIKKMTDEMHDTVRQKVEDYVRAKTMREMETIAHKGFHATVSEVVVRVQDALSKEAKDYFSLATVNETIVNYVKENQDHLQRIAAQQYYCFPGESEVVTPSGPKKMSDLCTGDSVLCYNSKGDVNFDDVIIFSYADAKNSYLYTTIECLEGPRITLSGEHLIAKSSLTNLVPANLIKPGDTLFYNTEASDAISLLPVEVLSINHRWQVGAFCPQTKCGSILVNGLATSCYSTAISPWMAQVVLFPVRILFSFLPRVWFLKLVSYTKENGMPYILSKIRNYFT